MLSRDGVRAQMEACDVFVLPSLGETFSVALAEAMACGRPVIATRCGGPEWIVTPDTGILVRCAAAADLAGAMAACLWQPRRFDPITIRGRVCERFGEKAFLEKIRAVYEEVIDTPPKSRSLVESCSRSACNQAGS
jgi:glycosyltransferase involved in cell wall biosynthesis